MKTDDRTGTSLFVLAVNLISGNTRQQREQLIFHAVSIFAERARALIRNNSVV